MTAYPMPRNVSPRNVLGAIVITFIIAGLIYSVSTPFLDVSDEVRHYAMVEQLAQGRGLPVQDPAHHGFYEQEGSQPPLYYALMALVALPFDRSDFAALAQFNPHARLGRADATNNWNQLIHTDAERFPWKGSTLVVQLIRFLGIAMGAVTVLCTYSIANELIRGSRPITAGMSFVPVLAAAFTAFNPMFVFISASVNNDTVAAMLSSIGLLLGLQIIRRGLNWQRAVVLGSILGCDAIAKSSALALVVAVPAVILISEWTRQRTQPTRAAASSELRQQSLRSSLLPLLGTLALVASISGWWYLRNAQLYHGDITGTTMMATIAGAREQLPSVAEMIGEWDGFRKAYLGLFGAVNIPMDAWIYTCFDLLLIIAAAGLVLIGWDFVQSQRVRVAPGQPPPGLGAVMCLGTFLIAFVALIRWTSLTYASQGRLLFPVIAVISTFTAWGLCRILDIAPTRRAARQNQVMASRLSWIVKHGYQFLLAVLPVGFAALTLLCPFLYIQPAYASPQRFQSASQLPADTTRTELRFEDGMRWIGYRVETERARPGDEFAVTLYWQGLKPMSTNYSAGIRLYGRNNTEVFLLDTYPGGGMWQTTRWQPGEIIADRYRLRIPDSLTITQLMPTVLRLDVVFWNFETKQFLKTFEASSGKPTSRQNYEAGGLATSGPTIEAAPGPYLSQARPAVARVEQVGQHLTFTVTWSATADFNDDYTVFAQLLDSQNKIVAQADGRAAANDFSARWWRKGDLVVDPHTFNLPTDLPSGNYTIKYGLYRKGDGARMPAFDARGQPNVEAALSLPVTIK